MSQTRLRCTGPTCKAMVVWDTLTGDASGKPHPFDEVTHKTCKGRGYVIVEQANLFAAGAVPGGRVECKRCQGKGTVLRSHFDSCSDADYFRTKAR